MRWVAVAIACLLVPVCLAGAASVKKLGGEGGLDQSTVAARQLSHFFQVSGGTNAGGNSTGGFCGRATWFLIGTPFFFNDRCSWPTGRRTRINHISVSLTDVMSVATNEHCEIYMTINAVRQSWWTVFTDDVRIACNSSNLTAGKLTTRFDTCTISDPIGSVIDEGDVIRFIFDEADPLSPGNTCNGPNAIGFQVRGEFL